MLTSRIPRCSKAATVAIVVVLHGMPPAAADIAFARARSSARVPPVNIPEVPFQRIASGAASARSWAAFTNAEGSNWERESASVPSVRTRVRVNFCGVSRLLLNGMQRKRNKLWG